MKSQLIHLAILFIFMASCSPINNERVYDLEIINDPEILSSRVLSKNQSISFNSTNFKQKGAQQAAAYTFTEYQEISTPEAGLSATYIAQRGNYLYITYHQQGVDYGGAIDVYNIDSGSLESVVTNPEIDWNSVYVDERNPGQFRLIVMGDTRNGAILHSIGMNGASSIQNEQKTLDLDGPSGNSVIRMSSSDRFYATSGGSVTDGGIFEIDYINLTVNNSDVQVNMKYLAPYGSNAFVALKGGATAELRVYNHPNFNGTPTVTYPIGAIEPLDGKNALFVLGNTAYASMGNNGIAVVDLSDGSFETISLPGTTNAVYADDEFIYASNGEMFHLLDVSTKAKLGSISFEGSANFVHTFSADFGSGTTKVIALANGTGGVRLIAATEIVDRDIQQTGSEATQWAPVGADRFSVGQVALGEPMLFEILDENGAVIESFGVDLPSGMGIHFQTSVEGEQVRATYNGFPGTEIDALPETASEPIFNDDPVKGAGGVAALTSRFDQNGKHIFTVDYQGNDIARVVVDQSSGPNFDLILQNGRNFFYASDGTLRILNKTTGQNIWTKAASNNTWGGLN